MSGHAGPPAVSTAFELCAESRSTQARLIRLTLSEPALSSCAVAGIWRAARMVRIARYRAWTPSSCSGGTPTVKVSPPPPPGDR